ncbi:UNKNOWN [Stylonychia lemnae]|uniref:RAP domain-containing protein n=1 Tax=Stylonychia lemnae TaxID=5949 RepID=A0A078A1Q2_STYLE|nr:UNKNOWN [Stylonychia lemnae]|eukprot:CDW75767.1 UNKNOWN [Stylonychia lemnae]
MQQIIKFSPLAHKLNSKLLLRQLLFQRAFVIPSSRGLAMNFSAPLHNKTQPAIDEETQEDLLNNRAMNIAQTQYQNDEIIRDIIEKNQTISQLTGYFNYNQKSFQMIHYSFMLYRLNHLVQEAKKYQNLTQEQIQNLPQNQRIIFEQNIGNDQMASHLQKLICFYIARNTKELIPNAIIPMLKVLSESSLDRSEMGQEQYALIEEKVMQEYPKYISLDLSSIVSAFLKLNYVPHQIIDELNKLQQLSTMNKYACLQLLEGLVDSKYNQKPEFYDKLLTQLKRSSQVTNQRLAGRALAILNKLKDITTDKDLVDHAQYYIDRYVESIRHPDQSIKADILLDSARVVRSLDNYARQATQRTLDLDQFNENYVRIQSDKIDKFRAEIIFVVYESFLNASDKKKFVDSFIRALRENRIDIRRFNVYQLEKAVQMIHGHSKKDLHVFHKFFDQCLEQGYYKQQQLLDNFSAFSKLFYIFVKEGFITQDFQNNIYYQYVFTLNDNLKKLTNQDIVNVLWGLIVSDDETVKSPLIAKIFEMLHEFKRDTPLTKDELIQLYQIHIYAQDKIKNRIWPKQFKDVIPQAAKDAAEDEFNQFDKNLFKDYQMDIAKKLLKLRCTFTENAKIHKTYRADFKLTDAQKIIVFVGGEMKNQKNSQLLGVYQQKISYLQTKLKDYQAIVIDLDTWKDKSEDEQYSFLFNASLPKEGDGFQSQYSF